MSKTSLEISLQNKFIQLFNSTPLLIKAPGRINLIGEHTDYNDGFVLPAAIDSNIVFAMARNDEEVFRFYSMDFNESFETDDIDVETGNKYWVRYLLGVLAQFRKENVELPGIDCVFGGDIPIGAGLSSSAALECGYAFGLNEILKTRFSKYQLVVMAQKAEHEYAGVMCGIMDQFASMFGKKDHVFRLDCRSHEYNYFPLAMDNHLIALVDTKVKHSLASSEYNKRRKECEEGVSIIGNDNSNIQSLRDVDLSMVDSYQSILDPVIYNRCHYVVSENLRVIEACIALEEANFLKFGELMYQSHDGLKNGYEVSCNELDILVDITQELDYVLGARMMGGGFGGCTINLINSGSETKFKKKISNEYLSKTGIEPSVYFVKLSDGVSIINN